MKHRSLPGTPNAGKDTQNNHKMKEIRKEIERLESGQFYTGAEAEVVMDELLSGRVETTEILRLLTALNQRPVQVQELAGFARVMRRMPRGSSLMARRAPSRW